MSDTESPWWFTRDEELLWGSVATREEAIAAGTRDFDGEPFFICHGGHFRNRCNIFETDWIADRFDDANADYAGEDGNPSEDWKAEHCRELESELDAVMKAWAERHGYDKAWAIDASPSELITPSKDPNNGE